jgi:ferric-dicitrate binding protein FerR (iron transport regulator)
MNQQIFKELLRRYLSEDLSPAELLQLTKALESGKFDGEITQQIEDTLKAGRRQHKWAEARQQAVFEDITTLLELEKPSARRLISYWWAVAAAVLILVAVWVIRSPSPKQPLVAQQEVIKPASSGAILTLADGRKMEIDSAGNAVIDQQGIKTKLDSGRLSYLAGNSAAANMFNTISTPKGKQFSVVLPDGTHAWLNAASSLRFPVSFSGNERKVTVTGEVYFEVSGNAVQPFKVSVPDGSEVTVLGTSFNVNTYAEEDRTAITLVSGKVSVKAALQSAVLQPGQQALSSGKELKIANVDIDKAVAWRYGAFDFTDMSFKQAMKQLERWYDVDIVYDDGITELPFAGKISNKTSLNSLLKILNGTSLKFTLEGRKLIVRK